MKFQTEDDRVQYYERLAEGSTESENGADKLAFDVYRLTNQLEGLHGRLAVSEMEMKDSIESVRAIQNSRFDCVSKRIISMENHIDGLTWATIAAVAISLVSVVAGIIGG